MLSSIIGLDFSSPKDRENGKRVSLLDTGPDSAAYE